MTLGLNFIAQCRVSKAEQKELLALDDFALLSLGNSLESAEFALLPSRLPIFPSLPSSLQASGLRRSSNLEASHLK
jgi:hypothetical protein